MSAEASSIRGALRTTLTATVNPGLRRRFTALEGRDPRSMTPPSNGGQPADNNDHLVQSDSPDHPANLIPSLCAKFWTLGWVTGTGGGASIRDEYVLRLASYPAIASAQHMNITC